MPSVALGVPNDGTDGTTALHARKILAAIFGGPGIVTGCTVGIMQSARYSVSEGVVACSRGDSDGISLAYVELQAVATTGNTSQYPRIDAIWAKANDKTQGDADNHVTVGVTQGTPSPNPSAPTLPTGATLLATMMLRAGATTTEYATRASVGKPVGTTMGGRTYMPTPTYRLYNKYDGQHLYTVSKDEYDDLVKAGWNGEGIAYYSLTAEA